MSMSGSGRRGAPRAAHGGTGRCCGSSLCEAPVVQLARRRGIDRYIRRVRVGFRLVVDPDIGAGFFHDLLHPDVDRLTFGGVRLGDAFIVEAVELLAGPALPVPY